MTTNLHANEKVVAGGKFLILAQALAYLLAGLAVTFTQAYHADVNVNRLIVGLFALLVAAATTASWWMNRRNSISLFPLIQAVAALVLGIFMFFIDSADALSLSLLVWAGASAVIFFLAWLANGLQSNLVLALMTGALAVILATLVRSLPAAMGFFGALGIVVGVYLAIMAFDPERSEVNKTEMQAGQ